MPSALSGSVLLLIAVINDESHVYITLLQTVPLRFLAALNQLTGPALQSQQLLIKICGCCRAPGSLQFQIW
jgi:hypothetical protein